MFDICSSIVYSVNMMIEEKDMTKKTRGATVKYRLYGKIELEKKFETVKEAKGFFYGYAVRNKTVTGAELIIH